MIIRNDNFDTMPVVEHRICDFHKQHPGESYAGCCCATMIGTRKATPAERKTNLQQACDALQKRIDTLIAEKQRLETLIAETPE